MSKYVVMVFGVLDTIVIDAKDDAEAVKKVELDLVDPDMDIALFAMNEEEFSQFIAGGVAIEADGVVVETAIPQPEPSDAVQSMPTS